MLPILIVATPAFSLLTKFIRNHAKNKNPNRNKRLIEYDHITSFLKVAK